MEKKPTTTTKDRRIANILGTCVLRKCSLVRLFVSGLRIVARVMETIRYKRILAKYQPRKMSEIVKIRLYMVQRNAIVCKNKAPDYLTKGLFLIVK